MFCNFFNWLYVISKRDHSLGRFSRTRLTSWQLSWTKMIQLNEVETAGRKKRKKGLTEDGVWRRKRGRGWGGSILGKRLKKALLEEVYLNDWPSPWTLSSFFPCRGFLSFNNDSGCALMPIPRSVGELLYTIEGLESNKCSSTPGLIVHADSYIASQSLSLFHKLRQTPRLMTKYGLKKWQRLPVPAGILQISVETPAQVSKI